MARTGLAPDAEAALAAVLRQAGLPAPEHPPELLSSRSEEGGTRIAVLLCLGDGRRAVFKHRSGPENARKFGAVVEAYRLFGEAHAANPRFGVPELLAHDAALQAILVGHLPGTSAETILETDPGRAELVLQSAGAWLAAHHAALARPAAPFNTRRPLQRLKLRMEGAEPPAPVRFRAFAKALRDRAPEIEGRELPEAVIHGDLTLGNLMIDGDRVFGIDFENPNPSAPERDIAILLVDFATRFPPADAAPEGALLPRRLIDAFRAGYGSGGDAGLLDFLIRLRLLHLWLSIPQDRAGRSLRRELIWREVRGAAERLGG